MDLNLRLLPMQRLIHLSNRDSIVWEAGRRSGKSTCHLQRTLMISLCFDEWIARRGYPGFRVHQKGKLSPISAIITPYLRMAVELYWDSLVRTLDNHPLVAKINSSQHKIDFKGNRPSLLLLGANDREGEGCRGKQFVNLQLDEVQGFHPDVFYNVLEPALADTPGSQMLATGTPLGKKSLLARLKRSEYFEVFHSITADNPTFPAHKLAEAREKLPPKVYQREYEASEMDFDSQYYPDLDPADVVTEIPPSFDLVVFGIDWGDINPAIVVMGRSANTWYYLDGYYPPSRGYEEVIPWPTLEKEIRRLAQKWKPSAAFCGHDRPSSILATRSILADYGCRYVKQGYNRIAEGISEVGSHIYYRRLKFYEPNGICYPGQMGGQSAWDELSSYHRKVLRDGTIMDEPAPGQTDHITDAIRLALATGKASPE